MKKSQDEGGPLGVAINMNPETARLEIVLLFGGSMAVLAAEEAIKLSLALSGAATTQTLLNALAEELFIPGESGEMLATLYATILEKTSKGAFTSAQELSDAMREMQNPPAADDMDF